MSRHPFDDEAQYGLSISQFVGLILLAGLLVTIMVVAAIP